MNPLSLLTKGRTFIGFKNRPSAYKLAKGMVVPNFSAGKGSSLSAASAPPTPSHRESAVSQPPIKQPTLFPQSETQTPAQTQLQSTAAGHTKSPATTGATSDLEAAANPITPAAGGQVLASTGILSYDSVSSRQKPPAQPNSSLTAAPNGQSQAKSISDPPPASISPQRPGPVRSVRSLLPEATHNISSRLGAVCQQFFRRWSLPRKGQPFHVPTVQTELALEKVTVVRNDLSEYDLEVVGMGKKKSTPYDQCQALSTNR